MIIFVVVWFGAELFKFQWSCWIKWFLKCFPVLKFDHDLDEDTEKSQSLAIANFWETGIKTIPIEKKYKKAKWLSEKALQIAVKRKKVKSKGEKERYSHLNAEFQRIARRDKKAFLSDQCREIEENNRMGKTRDLFRKIRDTKGTFHAKKGSIKDRNGRDLTEAEYIKKRW